MNTTSLAIIQPDDLDTIQRTGKMLAASGYFDAKGDVAQQVAMMATKILAGREMGFGPFASVNGIHIVQGKPTVGANLIASAIKASGRYTYKVRELTAKLCRIEFYEREGDKWVTAGVSEYTIEEAQTAGLSTKAVWKAFPKNMLFARAMSNGARWFAADIFSGNAVYVPEELGADVDESGEVIETTTHRIEPSTGEIFEPTKPANALETTDEEMEIIAKWANRTEAEIWAVQNGACANEYEARNSMEKSIKHCGGRVTKDNYICVYTHFLRRQMEKLNEMAEAAIDQAELEPEVAF